MWSYSERGDEDACAVLDMRTGYVRARSAAPGRVAEFVGTDGGDVLVSGGDRVGRLRRSEGGELLRWGEHVRPQELERVLKDPWASAGWIARVSWDFEPRAVAGLAAPLRSFSEEQLARFVEVLRRGHLWHNALIVPLAERLGSLEDERARRDIMRFLVEHPDARSTRAFEEVLTQPAPDDRVGSLVTEQAKLGRQGLVRIGTPESVGMVARYIEQMRQRPFAYDPCHERRCGAADRDGDGWPDDAEERLGTSPDNADSDGDGLPDPRDRCPLQKSSSAPMSEDDRAWQAALVALSVPWGVGPLEVSSDTLCFEGATVPLLHVPAAWWTSNRIRT